MSEIDYKAEAIRVAETGCEQFSGITDGCWSSYAGMEPIGTWRELMRLARLGAAVEAMPKAQALAYYPGNTDANAWTVGKLRTNEHAYEYTFSDVCYGNTPSDALIRAQNKAICGTPHGARPCPNDAH